MRKAILISSLVCIWAQSSFAASPEVCRPYATALTQSIINYAWSRAYSSCLLLEQDKPPAVSDWQAGMCIVLPGCKFPPDFTTPLPPGDAPATDSKNQAKEAAWKKCAAAHPQGWDEKTKTVTKLVKRKWVRVPCP